MSRMTAIALVGTFLLSGVLDGAAQDRPRQQPTMTRDARPDVPAASVPQYKPPLRGAPGGRVGGGTRGTGREVFVLSVLAPNHSGLTTSEQPTLYWYISSASPYPIEITVTDPRASQPLVERRLEPPVAAGVHAVRLDELGVRLDVGVAYQWYVAVVPDGGRRSRDILAGGSIERVEPTDDVRSKVTQAPRESLPFVYAEAGLWYNALAAISELIERAPGDVTLRRQRAALLTQVGLPEIGEGGN